MTKELFESATRENGDLAGVFEYDGETGYFYLYDVTARKGHKIVDFIHIFTGRNTELTPTDALVRWDNAQQRVGLFLRGVQWAVFNPASGTKHGGGYRVDGSPNIPPQEVIRDS
jgi:hypothetical protein